MATYYIDGNSGNDSNNGNSDKPWKTLSKALSTVQPGDEVRIRTAVYHETLPITTRNTTWRADNGHKPVIDGKYHDGLFNNGKLPQPGPQHLPVGNNANMVRMRADGIVIDGLIVRNCAGSGIGVSSSDSVIRNCQIDFTYDMSIKVNPGSALIDRVIIENNVCTRASVRYFDPLRGGTGSAQGVSGVIKMGHTRDGVIRNNIVAYGMGEGINIGKGSYRTLVEGNVVHTCNHVHIYNNRSIDTIIRNNLVFHLYTQVYLGASGMPPTGIRIGDESAKGNFPYTEGGHIYNNLVIGMGQLFGIGNNAHNFNTQLKKCYIGYNTFIGGKMTRVGIHMADNLHGRPHSSSVFENNIIMNVERISQAQGSLNGVTFRNNLWDRQPEAAMRGAGDRIGNPNLVNPTAELIDTSPDPITKIDPRNYQLTSRSTLAIGMASDGSAINGFQLPSIRKDFFGANRDAKPDIGIHEYAGVITDLTANFSIGPGQSSGTLPHTVDFVDKSISANPIVSRQWTFGDGGLSTETNPSYTYTSAGNFDVSLTVTDNQGNTDTMTQSRLIEVTSEPNAIIPDTFRRFALIQQEDQQVLAYGTQYPDLRCIVIWNDDPYHLMNFTEITDAIQNIAEPGKKDIFWIDPSDQDEPLVGVDDETEPIDEPVIRFVPLKN